MTNKPDTDLHWYKDAIIYELHVKAFCDSNSDGIGDIRGLIGKLDYLQELGVTAIWLLPFYPSPLRDDGYDIADYYSIHSSYGTMEDFKEFLDEAHARGLRVITELVVNHTSDQHPWFQRARQAPPGSPERNFYVWSDDAGKYPDVRIIFQDYETSNWTWDPVANQYYWHRFFHHQPDLNYDSPDVQAEIFNVLDFWCKMGVDGFRLDAIPYLFEREGTNGENLPETHAFLKKLRKHVDEKYPGTLLLAEANMWPEDSASYFGNGDECHMNYHFPVMPRIFMSLQMEDRHPVTDIFEQTPEIPPTCQWAIFLRNHDELTLEMVTDEERDYMYKVYVKDPRARINLGIRHRLAPLMDNNRRKIELLNSLLFSLPGTPVLYYGDEIGMGDNFYLGDRDGVRTPMQWSDARNAGFSECNPHQVYLPLILDTEYHYEIVNVELQHQSPSSLLWWTRRMIAARKKHKAFGRGDLRFLNAENPKVFTFTRTYKDETILVIANLSRFVQPVSIDLTEFAGCVPVDIFSMNRFPAVESGRPYFFTPGAWECQWYILEKDRQKQIEDPLPVMELSNWRDIATRRAMTHLERNVLPTYLMSMRWFGGKARTIQQVRIINHFTVGEKEDVCLFLVEVSYQSGLPEIYQLHVTFAGEREAEGLGKRSPQALIADISIDGERCVLYDALYSEAHRSWLFSCMREGRPIASDKGELRFGNSEMLTATTKVPPSEILSGEQSNTSIIYGNDFFMKIYRKVDRAVNPDLELSWFLTEQAHFPYVPAYCGSVEWYVPDAGPRPPVTLGMLQQKVAGSGDAWTYVLDRLHAMNDTILCGTKPDDIAKTEPTDAMMGEQIRLLGVRTGEMHLALASDTSHADFKPEPFSLHYQRSLFSSFQSLVRGTFQTLAATLPRLPESLRTEAEELLRMKPEIIAEFRKIYNHKLDVVKMRVHGDYHLGQVLCKGIDFVILDFEGEPARTYSERRLKRSPVKDVAGMIRSLHYAALGSLMLTSSITDAERSKLIPYMEEWYLQMSNTYLDAYLETVKGTAFVPSNMGDMRMLLRTFLLEKAIYELNYELNNRPQWVLIPLRGILGLMKESGPGNNEEK